MQESYDRRIDWQGFYRERLQNLKKEGAGWKALCPFHGDTNESLSVNMEKGLWHCHGCGESGNAQTFLQKAEGLSPGEAMDKLKKLAGIRNEPKAKFNLTEYAKAKKLPEEFLKELGLKNGQKSGITIPYYDESGAVVSNRQRHSAASTGPRFTWSRGSKVIPYGLWKLKDAREKGYIVLLEGESDTQTLWHHGLPALGIPGSSTFRADMAQFLTGLKVYMHQEPDAGGETFVKKICDGLVDAHWQGELYTVSTPGHKDPSELHVKNPKEFKDRWKVAMDAAREIDLASMAVKADEVIPGAPVSNRMPAEWRVTDKGVYMVKEEGLYNICILPVLLGKRLKSVDTGEEKIELVFRKDDAWHSVIVQRSTLFQQSKVGILADRGLTINSEVSKKFVKFLAALEAENLDILHLQKSSDHLGWITGSRFYPGISEGIVLDIDPASAITVNAYKEAGSYEAWKAAMMHYRQWPVFRFVLAAGFASPMLNLLRHRVFVIHMWGASRGGKTGTLKAALSVWGDPDILMTSFNATKVGIEVLAALYSDLPLGIDERQVAGEKQQAIESLLYMLGEGKGKIRGAKAGGLRNTKTWQSIIITTGEEPLSTDSSHTGINTRVLEIWGKPIESEKDARKIYTLVGDNHGWAGPIFIRKLVTEMAGGDLKTNYNALMNYLEENYEQYLGSHLSAAAIVCLADYYASQWIFDVPEEQAYDEALELAGKIVESGQTAEEADYCNRAVDWINSWMAQHKTNFTPGAQERYGDVRMDVGEIYILPSVLEPELRKAGFSPKRVYRDLLEQGYIRTDGDAKRFKKTVKMDGSAVKVIAIKTTAMDQQRSGWIK